MAEEKKVCILSIDGGGIRGILPGVILQRLEEKLQDKSGNKEDRLADYFDMISGTSTGGILTCAYLMPDTKGKSKFSAQEAVNLYLDRGDEIFDVSFWQKVKSVGGLRDEKYSAAELEEALMDNFGDTMLNELRKPCLVTSYDIRNRSAFFFRQQRANEDINNFLVRDVARATSAAPTYFEAARVKNVVGSPYPLVDGGVFANNPTMCAYSEARTMKFAGKKDKPLAENMIILSIGTGSVKKPYPYKVAKDWGLIEWIQPIIDIMMSGNSETVNYQMKQIFDSFEGGADNYHRLEPQLKAANSEMDDASPENLLALKEDGLSFISASANNQLLDDITEKLIANKI